jgi:hypothetical protein
MAEQLPPRASRPDRDSKAGWVKTLLESNGNDSDLLRECLWRLFDKMKQAATLSNRQQLYMVLLAIGFELVNRRLINEFSFQGAKLSAITFLRPLLPLAVAYCYLIWSMSWSRYAVYRHLIRDLTKQAFPGVYHSGVDELLMPGENPLVEELPQRFNPQPVRMLRNVIANGQLVLLLFGPILFEYYAFAQLYRHGNNSPIALSTLAALTSTLLIAGVALFMRDPHGRNNPRY